jgi:hypothetical protein
MGFSFTRQTHFHANAPYRRLSYTADVRCAPLYAHCQFRSLLFGPGMAWSWIVLKRVRKIAEKRVFASQYLSVRLSAWNSSAPNRRIFMKFDIRIFFRKSVEKI